MKLFLASEAKHPETVKKLEEFVGGLKDKKIFYIVTAANGEGWGSWRESQTLKILKNFGVQVEILQLEDYWTGDLPSFEDANVFWFAGGQPGYLMYWVRRTKFDLKLKELLNSGVTYVGSSAGSMVASGNLNVTEWYIGEVEFGAGVIPGLGLIDFDIYPHYQESLLPLIKENYKGKKLYLLKNGEEIIVEDGGGSSNVKITVIGEERIISNT